MKGFVLKDEAWVPAKPSNRVFLRALAANNKLHGVKRRITSEIRHVEGSEHQF